MTRLLPLIAAAALVTLPAFAAPPHRMIGNVYFVGQDDLASYLITTPKGHILVNTGFEFSVPVIKAGVQRLGFRYQDIKILLVTHAHSDHAAGLADLRKQTGAKMWAIEQEAPLLESGGKTDFLFGSGGWFKPVKVDHVFHDGDKIELGDTVITAHWTPGHTKGATSYSFEITENGKLYHVLIANLPSINEGTDFIDNDRYPNIIEDFQHTFAVLKSLPCDVFLSSHTTQFHFNRKYYRDEKHEYDPERYVDPIGYQLEVQQLEEKFNGEVRGQREEIQVTKDHLNFKDVKEPEPSAPPQQ
jgi:metallo-beta-lactamase class B